MYVCIYTYIYINKYIYIYTYIYGDVVVRGRWTSHKTGYEGKPGWLSTNRQTRDRQQVTSPSSRAGQAWKGQAGLALPAPCPFGPRLQGSSK